VLTESYREVFTLVATCAAGLIVVQFAAFGAELACGIGLTRAPANATSAPRRADPRRGSGK
jgi:hypothetical protein